VANQKVLVTGASRGIGAAIAQRFRLAGYEVLTPASTELDLGSKNAINAYVASHDLTGLTILVNNAGINVLASLEELVADDLERTLHVNVQGHIWLTKQLVPLMNGYGRIVNISSIWGRFSKVRRLAYTTAKAAMGGFTVAAAVELAEQGILVNAVAPGFVETEMTRLNNSPEALAHIVEGIPLGRLADPSELAEAVFFLASPQNSFMTGQTLYIDGGFSCV
jgi:NAD(P)-dependent dehydrogenase (short-subunit alcohol dehydrogenase family)